MLPLSSYANDTTSIFGKWQANLAYDVTKARKFKEVSTTIYCNGAVSIQFIEITDVKR